MKEETTSKKWYETFAIRGYSQIRYIRLLETYSLLETEQGDRSMGENGGFMIRQMRLIFSGNVGKHAYIYFQPNLASSLSSLINNIHFAQIRDAYFDIGFDKKKEFRIRIGQSKMPFGFENMQSSQNRIPLDRNDALNSAVSNERNLGAVIYWAPAKVRKLYTNLVADGLKGSEDYGVFGFGAYNSQTANRNETNNSHHIVSRLSYPIAIKNQIIEASVQGYKGKYVFIDTNASVKSIKNKNCKDDRMAASFTLYPKPFGMQAEYNVGVGTKFNKITDSIENENLKGDYVTFSYKTNIGKQVLIPFYHTQYYSGGKKFQIDARSYRVTENEIGMECQPNKNFELLVKYTMSYRRFEDFNKQSSLKMTIC
jgi:Phosphate-selective porin O and P